MPLRWVPIPFKMGKILIYRLDEVVKFKNITLEITAVKYIVCVFQKQNLCLLMIWRVLTLSYSGFKKIIIMKWKLPESSSLELNVNRV